MDPYLFCLILGFAGLAIMAASGLASHGGDHGGHGHSKEVGGHGTKELGGHGHGVKELGHGHGHDVHGHGHDAGHGHLKDADHGHVKAIGAKDLAHHDASHDGLGDDISEYLFSLLSPRVFFSILVGAGAAGLLLEPVLGGLLLMGVAAVAGFAFEGLLVRPFWNFLFRFASTPAQTLDSALMDRATAVTGFDAAGQGVVSIELDGQIVQLLGTLRPEDRHVRVRAGDALMVEDVDGRRNQCTVSWLGAGAPADGR
ncbi:hypothetical protein [Longimicrobium sp.]|uniref:hypothetical protein n=1 Tax=Longimicrobium sp. TaxID=2029185 RepID=UPI002E33F3FD|nr:hypothetical protein [Longimicrobium sp.]HEX6040558.1 hypothetical protein [Longimicrobium sp.]